ncbi:MAG: arsenic resistance N-acetyltransferase ArsN2 [Candidatus Manganitrophaceae bacterium]
MDILNGQDALVVLVYPMDGSEASAFILARVAGGENMTEWAFESAEPADLESVRKLLSEAALPVEDIAGLLPHFLLAKQGGRVIGCIGLEPRGELALLRSLAVAFSFRGRGIGRALCDRMINRARGQGIKTLYLLTTTAEGFFLQQGFFRIDREGVPAEIRSTEEFKSLCPETAVCLVRRINSFPSRGLPPS